MSATVMEKIHEATHTACMGGEVGMNHDADVDIAGSDIGSLDGFGAGKQSKRCNSEERGKAEGNHFSKREWG
jgi:hypothetical protein